MTPPPDELTPEDQQDQMAREKRLLAKYPFHIYLMVKAAKQALDEGRARIEDGILIVDDPVDPRASRPQGPAT